MFPVLAAPAQPVAVLAEVLDAIDERGGPAVEQKTARKVERKPTDERILAHAWTLTQVNDERGDWCDAVADLLLPLDDPTWIPWAEVVFARSMRACPGEAWPHPEEAKATLEKADWNTAIAQALAFSRARGGARHGHALHAAVLEARATCYFSVGDHERAVDDLTAAIALEPSPDRRLRLGLSQMALGREDDARAQLSVGLVMDARVPKLVERAQMALDVLGPAPEMGAPTVDLRPGAAFPDLAIEMDGESMRLSDLDGPLVVDVWATWCAPCIQALPDLARLGPEWASKGVTLVGVSVDEHRSTWARFVDRRPLGYPAAWAGPAAMADLGLNGLPAAFVLDAEHRFAGFVGGWQGPGDDRLDTLVDQVTSRDATPE